MVQGRHSVFKGLDWDNKLDWDRTEKADQRTETVILLFRYEDLLNYDWFVFVVWEHRS